MRGSAFIPHLKEGVFSLCLRAPQDKKQDYYNVIEAAKILLDGIEGLDCVIDNLYCCEV